LGKIFSLSHQLSPVMQENAGQTVGLTASLLQAQLNLAFKPLFTVAEISSATRDFNALPPLVQSVGMFENETVRVGGGPIYPKFGKPEVKCEDVLLV
jgi:hypothetical protein